MKIKITILAFFGFFVNLNTIAQSSQVDTAFCRFFNEFVIFSATQNNTSELDLVEMGMDTLLHEGETEDDLDFIIRTTTSRISRMIYRNMDVYKVIHQAYPQNQANIIHDKLKNIAYYRESFKSQDESGFSNNYGEIKQQLLQAFRACSYCANNTLLEVEFNTAAHIPQGVESFYKDLTVHVFKVKDFESDFRIVLNVNTSPSTPHFYLYLIHKDFIKEIVLR
ncbi:MAG: hypothetical protein V4622_14130 [Bacteroidota bacterium]